MNYDNLVEITQHPEIFLLVFLRMIGIFLFAPVVGSWAVPVKVRIILALGFSFLFLPSAQIQPVEQGSLVLILRCLNELVFGMAIGISSGFIFFLLEGFLKMIEQQMGFNIGALYYDEPQTYSITDFKLMLATIVYLLINGHHELFRAIHSIPASPGPDFFTKVSDYLFSGALVAVFKITAPLVVSLLAVHVLFCIFARTLPQISIFNVGINFLAIFAIVVLILLLPVYVQIFSNEITSYNKLFLDQIK